MKCRHCLKELHTRIDYCPFCGMALQPSTEVENRKKPVNKGLITKGLLFAGLITIVPFVINTFQDGLQEAVHSTPFFLFVALAALLVGLSRPLYDILRGRNLPLLKRLAVVAKKRCKRRGNTYINYITFSFPDKTQLEFESAGIDNELEIGNRIILKYKLFGKFQPRPVIYGYERIKRQPEE